MAKLSYSKTAYIDPEEAARLAAAAESSLEASSDIIVAGANTTLGIDALTTEEIALQNQQNRSNLQDMKEQNMNWFDHTARAVTKTTIAAFDYPSDVITNIAANTAAYASNEIPSASKSWEQLTPEEQAAETSRRQDIFWNGTNLGNLVGSTFDFIAGNRETLDTGSDWWLTDDSQVMKDKFAAQAKVAGWDPNDTYGERTSIGNFTNQLFNIENDSVQGNAVSTIADMALIGVQLVGVGGAFKTAGKAIDEGVETLQVAKGIAGEGATFSQRMAAIKEAKAINKEQAKMGAVEAVVISREARGVLEGTGDAEQQAAFKTLVDAKARIIKSFPEGEGQKIIDTFDDMVDDGATVYDEIQQFGDYIQTLKTADGQAVREAAALDATGAAVGNDAVRVSRTETAIESNERGKTAAELSFFSSQREKNIAIKENDTLIKNIDNELAILDEAVDVERVTNLRNTRARAEMNGVIIRESLVDGGNITADTLRLQADTIKQNIADSRYRNPDAIQTRIDTKTAEVATVKEQLAAAKIELTNARAARDVTIKGSNVKRVVNSKIKQAEVKVAKIENDLKEANKAVVAATNQRTATAATKRVTKLQDELKSARAEASAARAESRKLAAGVEVKSAKASVARAEAKVKQLAGRVAAKEKTVTELNKSLQSAISTNKILENSRAATSALSKQAQLYADLDNVNAVLRANNERMNIELINKAQEIAQKYSIKSGELNTYDEAVEFLKDIAGMRKGISNSNLLNVEQTLQFATNGGLKNIIKIILEGNKVNPELNAARIFKYTRGKLDVQTIQRLSKATDEREAMAILIEAVSFNSPDIKLGRLRALQASSRILDENGNIASFKTLSTFQGKVENIYNKVLIYGYEKSKNLTPWSYRLDPRDVNSMVNATNDLFDFTYGAFGIPTFGAKGKQYRLIQDKYVSKMINATTSNERKLIFWEAQEAMARFSGESKGLDKLTAVNDKGETVTQLDVFIDAFKSSIAKQNNMIARMAKLNLERLDKGPIKTVAEAFGLKKEVHDSAILYNEMLNHTVTMMNPYEMRKMFQKGKTIDEIYTGKGIRYTTANGEDKVLGVATIKHAIFKLTTDMYDRFFRRAMLFRFGYVLRNVIETQIRMFLKGHPNTLTNPLLWFTMVGKKTDGAESLKDARLDARGLPFADENTSDMAARAEFEQSQYARLANRGAMIDPGYNINANTGRRMGFQYASPRNAQGNIDKNYRQGIADFIYRLTTNEVAMDVLKSKQGNIRKEVWAWAKENKLDKGYSYEQIIVEYYWKGPGYAQLEELAQANKNAYAGIFNSKENVYQYLFGNNEISVSTLLNAFTNNFDPKIVEAMFARSSKIPHRENIKNIKEAIKDYVDAAYANPENARIKSVPYAAYSEAGKIDDSAATIGDIFEMLSDKMFKFSSWGEKTFATLPEFRYSYWDYMSKNVMLLSPEEAAKVVATAEKTLGNVTSSWARGTLKALKKNAENAAGSGIIKIDEIHDIANNAAARNVAELFYDANKRNAFGHALRLISPFGQAWANSMIVWGKLAATNMQQVYRAEIFFRSLESENSGWLNTVTMNGIDPSQPFIYKDPATNKKVYGIPLSGLLGGVLPQYGYTMDVSSQNLIMQNGFAPGFGPIVQIVENALASNDIYRRLIPEEIRTMVNPYSKDPNVAFNPLASVTPAWFQELNAGWLFPERRNKYVTGAMATLLQSSPEKYLNDQGVLDSAGQTLLVKDAESVSNSLAVGRGIAQFFAPGATKIEAKIEDKDGRYVLSSVIAGEFHDYLNQGFDQQEAMGKIVDQYGIEASLSMITTSRLGYTPTDGAWEYYKNNPESFDEHSTVLPLIYPGGGYSTQLANYMSTGDKALNSTEKALQINRLLRSAKESELDNKFAKGLITADEYEVQLDNLKETYKGAPTPSVSTSYRESVLSDLRDAMKDDTLANSNVGKALDVYLQNRDYVESLGYALDAKRQAGNREMLYSLGTQLAQQYPEFNVVWFKVLRGEVKPDVGN